MLISQNVLIHEIIIWANNAGHIQGCMMTVMWCIMGNNMMVITHYPNVAGLGLYQLSSMFQYFNFYFPHTENYPKFTSSHPFPFPKSCLLHFPKASLH